MRISDWSSDVCSSDLSSRAAEDVAAADHHADLGPGLLRLDDLARQAADHLGVDAVVLVPHQGLAGELEQDAAVGEGLRRSEEHTSELQSLMRISYAVFCLKKKTNT